MRWLLVAAVVALLVPMAMAQSGGSSGSGGSSMQPIASCSTQEGETVLVIDGGSANCRSSGDFPTLAVSGASLGVLGGLGFLAWSRLLRWLPAMGGFTRLRKDKLLDHPVRAHLHQLIEEEPGIHFQALLERTGKANGQISHHLATLVRAELVTTVRAKGYSTYFLKGTVDAPIMQALSAVRSPTAVAVLRAVAEAPGAPTRGLADRIGRPESTVRHHCHKLARAGLVDGQRVLSAVGQQVIAYIPEAVGRPKRPPGPKP